MDNQIYTPEVIADTPFPTDTPTTVTTTQASTNNILGQATTQDNGFPIPTISVEVLSQALNTKSKKILQEFQFTPSGALQIGNFEEGVNGDIRLSPNGIVGRDLAGNTTFAVDGDTGDAIFQGEVRAQDFIIADNKGLVSLANFANTSFNTVSNNQAITSTSATDVTGSSFTVVCQRDQVVLFSGLILAYLVESVGNTADANMTLVIDGVSHSIMFMNSGNDHMLSFSFFRPFVLAAGSHNVKLQAVLTGVAGSPSLILDAFLTNYVTLGS